MKPAIFQFSNNSYAGAIEDNGAWHVLMAGTIPHSFMNKKPKILKYDRKTWDTLFLQHYNSKIWGNRYDCPHAKYFDSPLKTKPGHGNEFKKFLEKQLYIPSGHSNVLSNAMRIARQRWLEYPDFQAQMYHFNEPDWQNLILNYRKGLCFFGDGRGIMLDFDEFVPCAKYGNVGNLFIQKLHTLDKIAVQCGSVFFWETPLQDILLWVSDYINVKHSDLIFELIDNGRISNIEFAPVVNFLFKKFGAGAFIASQF